MKKSFITTLSLLLLAVAAVGQSAELHIVNTSGRTLTIKIMQDNGATADTLYSNLSVNPYGRAVKYFAQTGNFYLKTQADLNGNEPVYTKGDAFEVYVGRDGYSVLTITYSITESNVRNPLDGRQISKSEFERN